MNIEKIDLSGQVAVVTGGSRGIGREIALHLAKAGVKVAVTARDKGKLASVAKEIEARESAGLAVEMEVTDRESVEAAIRKVEQSLGPVDLLVNNAGISGPKGHLWEVDPEDWWKVLEVNVRGVMLCTRAVLPGMLERGRGRIINMGSNAGIFPFPEVSAYCTSKAALLRFTDTVAADLEDRGIPIFAVSPGLVLTDMTEDLKKKEVFAAADWTPIERIAELSVYLASGKADVLTGRYIHARSDDIEKLVRDAEKIREDDTYALRLRVPND